MANLFWTVDKNNNIDDIHQMKFRRGENIFQNMNTALSIPEQT